MRKTGLGRKFCAQCSLIMALVVPGCPPTSALLGRPRPTGRPADGLLSTIVSMSAFVSRNCKNGSAAKLPSAETAAVAGDRVLKRCGVRFFAVFLMLATFGSTLI